MCRSAQTRSCARLHPITVRSTKLVIQKKLGNVFELACVPERVTRSSRVSPLEVKLAAMASTEKPVSMMFLLTLDARETRLSRRPSETGTDGPPVWFWEKT
jgi:hypothetical protein